MNQTVLHAAGGPRFLSRRVLVWLAPAALVTSVLTRDPESVADVVVWTAVNVASLVATWLWIETLRILTHPASRTAPVNFFVVLIAGASIGLVKGVTTSVFGYWAGATPQVMDAQEWWRTFGVVLQGALMLPAVTVAAATIDDFRANYQALMRAYARSIPPQSDRHTQLIGGFLTEAREKIGAEHGRALTVVIDRLLHERLKPLTRELWGSATAHTDFTVRSLAAAAIRTNPFPIVAVTIGYGLSGFASRAQELPLDTNVVRTGVSVATIALVFVVARRTRPEKKQYAVTHFVAVMATLVLVHVWVVERLTAEPTGMSAVGLTLTLSVWFPILTLVGGAVVIAWRGAERTRDLFAELVSEDGRDTVHALTQLRNRELANQLHSTVQNRLVAAARRIEHADFSLPVIRDEQAALSRLLDDVANSQLSQIDTFDGVKQACVALHDMWDGFVTVTVTTDVWLEQHTQDLQQTVTYVLTEAVNNAVRHGHAKTVVITIHDRPDTVIVRVEDDGDGPTHATPGVGTALFDSVSDGRFTLTLKDGGGTALVVPIAVLR